MDYKVNKLDKKQVVFTITLSETEWQEQLDKAYNRYKGRYSVVGFRPGKAPRKVIEKTYGEGVFFEDALSDSFYDYFTEVLSKEKDLDVVGTPKLNVLDISQKTLVIEATADLQPEVVVKKYTGFNIKPEVKNVTDEDITEQLERLKEQNVRFVEKDKASELGDTVNIDFSGSVNGKKFDGGTAQGFDLELGSKSFIDTFEEQLVGLKAGDKKDVVVTFPKNYHSKDLAGKESVFEVKVNAVKVKEYPTIDDEFISNTTEFETLNEYKENMKKQLQSELEVNAKFEQQSKILEKVLENTEVELPESMVEHEVEHILGDFENRLMYQGLDLNTYLNYMNTTLEEFKKERREDAEKNVKIQLALQHIMKKEKLDITEQEIENKIAEYALQSRRSVEDYKKMLDDHAMGHIKNDILTAKILDFLLKNNEVAK